MRRNPEGSGNRRRKRKESSYFHGGGVLLSTGRVDSFSALPFRVLCSGILFLILCVYSISFGQTPEKDREFVERKAAFGPKIDLKTVAVHPHDRGAYTQGLIFHEGVLYESTGQYGRSSLRKVDIASGEVLQKVSLKPEYFGEGIERIGDRIYFLTWTDGLCFVFDRESLKFQKAFQFQGEGWGLAYDGTHLILSNGTSSLKFFDPENFKLMKKIEVYEGDSVKSGRKISFLNELEIVENELWANVWKTDRIVRIDPKSGKVLGWINCAAFIPDELRAELRDRQRAERVLNGIAYDPEKRRIYITGKEWPVLYEIEWIP